MSLSRSLRRAAAASLLAALAVPVAASAHPGVYTVSQKQANGTETYDDDPTGANLGSRVQYAIANDGYARGFTEDNGLTGVQADGTAGMLDYKQMPGTWREPMDAEEKRTYTGAQTGVQGHATCTGSTLLNTPANIRGWQGADPFFNYIPWQKTSASLGDDPTEWMPLVKTVTGVDLSTLSSEADFEAACESAPVSGTYHKADTPASITTAMLADAVGPLQSQVSQLTNQVTALQAGKAASDTAAATAEAGRLALLNRPLTLTLSARRFDQPVAMVTGASGTPVTVTVRLSSAVAKRLKISRTVATKKATLDAQGAELLTLTPSSKATRAIAKGGKSVKLTIAATGAGKTVTKSGTLNR